MSIDIQWPSHYRGEESSIGRTNALKKEKLNFPLSLKTWDRNKCTTKRLSVRDTKKRRVRVVCKPTNELKRGVSKLT